jgi:hypothetical protein
MSDSSFRIVYVNPRTGRQRFRETGILERILNGELHADIFRNSLAKPSAGQPPGTRSQMVRYRDRADGTTVVIVHRYLLPDGTLGGSGLPDPKWLLDGDSMLVIQ